MNEVPARAQVLVVDDQPELLELLHLELSNEGWDTHVASDGGEALEILKTTNVDLVLSDIQMPKMSGLELLEKVKTHSPDTEVILMTGFARLETAVEAVNLGAHSYIQKPFHAVDVLSAARRALERQALIREREELFAKLQTANQELHEANREIIETRDRLLWAERRRTLADVMGRLRHELNNLAMSITSAAGCARRALDRGQARDVRRDLDTMEDLALQIARLLAQIEESPDVESVDYVQGHTMMGLGVVPAAPIPSTGRGVLESEGAESNLAPEAMTKRGG